MFNIGATKDWMNFSLKGRRRRKHRKGQGRKIIYDKEVEDKILQWFLEKRDLQLAVSTEIL